MNRDTSKLAETWSDKPLASLMDHIIEQHHTFCRQEVARLGALFKEVIARHSKDYPELKRMEALFSAMAKELQMHLVKEEQTLFPYIARVEEAVRVRTAVSWPPFGTVENPIRMMVLEHDQTDEELKEINCLSNGYTPPADAPEGYLALYDGLRAFERDMSDHIHAEDHLLFPRAVSMEEEACTKRKPDAG
ncbi:MAG: hemerythrin domain-containing protein [Bryobacteraceae bacterium]|jgi:regulator of cell morphogenesis and NO signaling